MNTQETQDTRSGPFAGHTPGPWEVHQSSNGIEIGTEHVGGSHWVVCDIAAPKSAIAMPNARLIAAAPSLLAVNAQLVETLEEVTDRYSNLELRYFRHMGTHDGPETNGSIARARAALSAARALEGGAK